MRIVEARWEVTDPVKGARYRVKGEGPKAGGAESSAIKFGPVVAKVEKSGDKTYLVIPASHTGKVTTQTSFEQRVRFFNPFTIDWEISVNGGEYKPAGSSSTPIYVCLAGPGKNFQRLYRTVVHLACSNEGATTAESALLNTWNLIKGREVKAWDKDAKSWTRVLYYYRAGTTFPQNAINTSQALLAIDNASGQCTAWAAFMLDACALNGAATKTTSVRVRRPKYSRDYQGFLVKEWDFGPSTNPKPNTYNFFTLAQNVDQPGDLIPPQPNQKYGDLTNVDGLAGQNNVRPSQKAFQFHLILEYKGANGTIYYDPSYGVTHVSPAAFQENAIAGFWKDLKVVINGERRLEVFKPPNQEIVYVEFIN